MALQFIALLLTMQIISGSKIDTEEFSPIDTLSYGGFNTPIFSVNEVILAQPVITVEQLCPNISYNVLLQSYQLELSVQVDENPLETAGRRNFDVGNVGKFELTKILVDTFNNERKIFVKSATSSHHKLIILCGTLKTCKNLMAMIRFKSNELQEALSFKAVGKIDRDIWKFSGVRIATQTKLNCTNIDNWIVVQRRVDGSLSFAQNWNTYQIGFGSPDKNYWMGLEKLHLLTVKVGRANYKCKLIIELEDWKGKSYWGQWNLFQVLGAEDNYRLKVGEEVPGTDIHDLAQHNNMQFSTYDKDNDRFHTSCSISYRKVGWWFNTCYSVNINGEYSTAETKEGDTQFNIVCLKSGWNVEWVPMKKSLMKVQCP